MYRAIIRVARFSNRKFQVGRIFSFVRNVFLFSNVLFVLVGDFVWTDTSDSKFALTNFAKLKVQRIFKIPT